MGKRGRRRYPRKGAIGQVFEQQRMGGRRKCGRCGEEFRVDELDPLLYTFRGVPVFQAWVCDLCFAPAVVELQRSSVEAPPAWMEKSTG